MSLLIIQNGVVVGGPQTPYIRSLFNTYVGDQVGDKNTTGSNNSVVGKAALYENTTGSNNSVVGCKSLYFNNSGSSNSAVGAQALFYNTTGSYNSAMGMGALYTNTTGVQNSAVGMNAIYLNTTGSYNSAVGMQALYSNSSGNSNSAMGMNALRFNTIGNQNSAVGMQALYKLAGNYHNNTALGFNAGRYQADGATALTTPSQSVYIGSEAQGFNDSDVNSIVIGFHAKGIGANAVVLGNDSIAITALKGKVGIGTTAPNANALLDIISTTKAVMFPRMTTAQRDAIDTPTEGMLIYNLTTHVFNFYAAAAWGAI